MYTGCLKSLILLSFPLLHLFYLDFIHGFLLLLKLQLEHKEDHVTFTFHQSVNSGSLHKITLLYYAQISSCAREKVSRDFERSNFSYFQYYQSD